jgi:ATP-dependent Clp protease ATP-binding subunit ClpX
MKQNPRISERSPILTPRQIFDYLDRYVVGQERAKRTVAIAAYNHLKRCDQKTSGGKRLIKKSNVLLVGPTGSGKTHIARTLATCLDVPFTVADATEYTEAGYYGKDVEVMVGELLHRADQDVERAQRGIVFIDEVDKITGSRSGEHGPDVSGEGVQRDLLPVLEGSTVHTRYGAVHTDHILFIAAGAFTMSRPSDLIPEFQGRFPIRVELRALNENDLERILVEPSNSLTKQYIALLGTEGVTLEFTPDGLRELAHQAAQVNLQDENIGVRRLFTILEKVLEDVSFRAEEFAGTTVTVDASMVRDRLGDLVRNEDLRRYVL